MISRDAARRNCLSNESQYLANLCRSAVVTLQAMPSEMLEATNL